MYQDIVYFKLNKLKLLCIFILFYVKIGKVMVFDVKWDEIGNREKIRGCL